MTKYQSYSSVCLDFCKSYIAFGYVGYFFIIFPLYFQAKSEVSKLRDEVKKMEEKLKGLESQGNLVCTRNIYKTLKKNKKAVKSYLKSYL